MCGFKNSISMLGVVFAVVAVLSSQASAVEPGWDVNGTRLTGTAALVNTAFVDEKFALRSGTQIEVKCEGTTLKGESPVINGATKMGDASSLEFTECSGGKVCPLGANQKETIKTLPVLLDLTLDGVLAVKGRFLPTNAQRLFATIEFGGTECAFSGVLPVAGYQTFLASTGQDPRTWQLITATHEEDESLRLGSSFIATILGSILVRLVSGLPYNFL